MRKFIVRGGVVHRCFHLLMWYMVKSTGWMVRLPGFKSQPLASGLTWASHPAHVKSFRALASLPLKLGAMRVLTS